MTDEFGGDVLYSVTDVARLLKLNDQTVRRYCRDGSLGAIKIGKQWRIPASAVSELLEKKPHTEGELNDGFQRIRIS